MATRRRRRAWLAAAVAVAASVATAASVRASGAPAPGLPRLGTSVAVEVDDPDLNDMGDPVVVAVPAGVGGLTAPGYAVAWTTDWSANVPVAVSTDLRHWRRVPDALPRLPRWAAVVAPPGRWHEPPGVSTMTWGPTIRQVGGSWVLWFATESAATHTECIGVATAPGPLGPYASTAAAPLVCQPALGGDIDPSVITVPGGGLALVWKNDGNAVGAPVGIWEQRLTRGGTAVAGAPVRLLGADAAWEHGIVEGPAMLAASHGGYWLFFSGGTWQSNTYDTGVAWCATVAGPCRDVSPRPLLASTPTAVSPGGLDTFVDHAGRLRAAYSAFPSAPADARAAMASPRVLELAPVLSR
ncbi:MAG TPA: glycoside hydrolase family 43 protein [Acidimicrobiales bacterium]|nr:glycoside hydrolase family 43 protein [Acidimicrobiales bacterium]